MLPIWVGFWVQNSQNKGPMLGENIEKTLGGYMTCGWTGIGSFRMLRS